MPYKTEALDHPIFAVHRPRFPLPGAVAKASPQDEAVWRLLHRLADAATPAVLREVETLLREVGVHLPTRRLRTLLNEGDLAGVESLLRATWQAVGPAGWQETVVPQLEALALQAAAAMPVDVGLTLRFNVQDPEALRAIQAHAGARITAISATTLEAVRGIVQTAFASGTSLTHQIAAIQDQIGLTPRQTESVERYRQGLVEAGEKPGRIAALVEARSTALRQQRAEAIARTETMEAVHAGQQERWTQAAREGLLEMSRFRRFPVITPDDRLCPHCARIPGMNPQGRRLDEPFDTPYGPLMFPPFHPLCRCSVSGRVA